MDHKQIIKDVARKCFECAKETSCVDNFLRNHRIIIDGSPIDGIFYHHMRVLEVFTDEDVADDCEWWQSLVNPDYADFECFWNEYYEGRI